jgi:hypothetical protein
MSTTKSLLARVRARMALVAAVEDFERAAPWGAGAALALFVTDRLGWTSVGAAGAIGAGAGVALLLPLGRVLFARKDDGAVAAAADERLGLAERLSTALWCERTHPAEAAAFAPLVVADAEAAAARVRGDALGRAFRPRALRRPLLLAGSLAAACLVVGLTQRGAEAVVETEAERVARLANADRLAEVARKIKEAAKRVAEAAAEEKKPELAKVAAEVQKKVDPLTRAPAPQHQEALKQLNTLADLAREQARRSAGMMDPKGAEEAADQDKALEQLLEQLSRADLGPLKKDLQALEERLKAAKKGETGEKPSAQDIRDMANRLDSLRAAMERAAQGDAAAKELLRQLRSIGNEELLEKIAEKLREIAARLDRGESYENLQSPESEGEEMDLSEMSEEELKELLKQLEQLASMKELEKMLRDASGELRGGRKLRLGGAGGS